MLNYSEILSRHFLAPDPRKLCLHTIFAHAQTNCPPVCYPPSWKIHSRPVFVAHGSTFNSINFDRILSIEYAVSWMISWGFAGKCLYKYLESFYWSRRRATDRNDIRWVSSVYSFCGISAIHVTLELGQWEQRSFVYNVNCQRSRLYLKMVISAQETKTSYNNNQILYNNPEEHVIANYTPEKHGFKPFKEIWYM